MLLAALLAVVPACGGAADSAAEVPLPPVGNTAGLRAPTLIGQTAAAATFRLDSAGAVPAAVVFYRGAYCGLCRERLRALQEHLAAYRAAGVWVVAVTLDTPPEIQRTVQQLGLEFPVVAADTATFAAWGALDAERRTALPASFLLDSLGVIRFRHVGRNAADRATDAALLTAVRQSRESE